MLRPSDGGRSPEPSPDFDFGGDPNGTRTRVFAVKGRRPRPLDDGADAADRRLRQAARGGQPGGGAPSPGYTSTFAIAASQTGQKGRSVRCIRHSAVGR